MKNKKKFNSPYRPKVSPQSPLAFHLMAKPTGAVCNLDCKYCFFLSKEMLYPGSHFRMSHELLRTYIRQLFKALKQSEVTSNWQGGELTLMRLDFFQHSMDYVEKHKNPGEKIMYTIQMNDTKIDKDWAAFFKQHDFLVGLSVDGLKELHDTYRVNKGGQGSFDQVLKAWKILMQDGVDVNILCTVNAAIADHPMKVYQFFRDELKAQYMQFILIVERATPETLALANQGWGERPSSDRPLYKQVGELVTERAVKHERYGCFLITIFDEWVQSDIGKIFLKFFDAALANWLSQASQSIFQHTCGGSLALEHNGDLYACDHYVEPDYQLGNIRKTHIRDLVSSDQPYKFGQDNYDTLPPYCQQCEVLFACYWEYPRNRFIRPPCSEPYLNYLCAGFKLLFTYIDHPMRLISGLLRSGGYADEVMSILAKEEMHVRPQKV